MLATAGRRGSRQKFAARLMNPTVLWMLSSSYIRHSPQTWTVPPAAPARGPSSSISQSQSTSARPAFSWCPSHACLQSMSGSLVLSTRQRRTPPTRASDTSALSRCSVWGGRGRAPGAATLRAPNPCCLCSCRGNRWDFTAKSMALCRSWDGAKVEGGASCL